MCLRICVYANHTTTALKGHNNTTTFHNGLYAILGEVMHTFSLSNQCPATRAIRQSTLLGFRKDCGLGKNMYICYLTYVRDVSKVRELRN